jgi:hypothetical protein
LIPGVVLCRTKLISHDSVSDDDDNEDNESEPNNSSSDRSEELQTAFREEADDDRDRNFKVKAADFAAHFLFVAIN